MTELFELMNSPSCTLYTNYVILLKGIDLDGEGFIFEELLQLKRTGRLVMLEEFIDAEQGDFMAEHEVKDVNRLDRNASNGEESNESGSSSNIDDNPKQTNKKMTYTSSQQRHFDTNSKTQLMRNRILSKLKFIIQLTEPELSAVTANYSTLL
jgi:hypothetical protein